MNAAELRAFLHERIPLSRAMAVEVRRATPDGVTLYAPLEPNINHRDTVFGGSASAVAILAAWSALYLRMRSAGLSGRILIRRNTMSYERPIAAGFTASAVPPGDPAWTRLAATLGRNRAARIRVGSVLESEGAQVGVLDGEFVVMPHTTPDPASAAIPASE
jgi:thioesterase domain-containing protein